MVVTSIDWRASLIERGYAHFPRVVPALLLEPARTAIAGELKLRYDAAREQEYGSRTYCPEIIAARPIMDLLERPPVLTGTSTVSPAITMACRRGRSIRSRRSSACS